jgi:hypothetical protein
MMKMKNLHDLLRAVFEVLLNLLIAEFEYLHSVRES